jgi:hypothetical protein
VSGDEAIEIFNELVNTCAENPNKIHVWPKVVEDASEQFRLHTKSEIIAFIGNRGLLEVHFLEKKPLDASKQKDIELIVFSFEFKALKKFGYLAFYRSPKDNDFIIKSFHLSHRQKIGDVSKSPQYKNALKGMGLSGSALKRLRGQNEQ